MGESKLTDQKQTTRHGSPELDADAEKLAAMGADPGATFPDIGGWQECWDCGGSGEGDDCMCGDDTCCCLNPEMGPCGTCHGEGGWIVKDASHG